MKHNFIITDMQEISKSNPITNEKVDISEILLHSTLPKEYQKIILCLNTSWSAKNPDYVPLGASNNNKFFEFISNHPFNFSMNDEDVTLLSATFGKYLGILLNKKAKRISLQAAIDFYESLKENDSFEDYCNLLYVIFTNAYDKSYPPIPKELKKYRESKK